MKTYNTDSVGKCVTYAMAFLGVVAFVAVRYLLPECYSVWLFMIPVFYAALGLYNSRLIKSFGGQNERKILNGMMLYKGVKLGASIGMILVFYFVLEGAPRNAFLIGFMFFFLLMTGAETFAFGNFERVRKLSAIVTNKQE